MLIKKDQLFKLLDEHNIEYSVEEMYNYTMVVTFYSIDLQEEEEAALCAEEEKNYEKDEGEAE